MLEGTQLRLRILAPTLDDPIARTAAVRISDRSIEFDNARYLDLSGDPYFVVAAQLDLTGATLSYTVIDRPGRFLNVDDETGFNGYAMTFMGLRNDPSRSIHSVKVIAGSNTLDIPLENMFFNRDTIFVDVDGLPFATGDGVAARIGFRIVGTDRNDLRRGAEGDDLLLGHSGADRLIGNAGQDVLRGGQGNDALLGGAGGDRLDGGAGRDMLTGGAGRDLLIGAAAADIFVFAGRFGADTIRDFDPDQSGERIDLSGVRAITSFRDLRTDHLSERGGDAFIDAGGGHTIRLAGVSAGDLSADDFIF